MCECKSVAEIVDWVYPDIPNHFEDDEWLGGRGILAPLHVQVNAANQMVLDRLPGESMTFLSADGALHCETATDIPLDFLHSRHVAGVAPHKLVLKPGAIVILLINLATAKGACNGTRMRFVRHLCQERVLECVILTGAMKGQTLFVPRIPITMDESYWPWPWIRKQFPVQLAFAMTINKAQGQTLQRCGLLLDRTVFAHGQLYVGMSRVGDPDQLQAGVHTPQIRRYKRVW